MDFNITFDQQVIFSNLTEEQQDNPPGDSPIKMTGVLVGNFGKNP